MSSSKGIKFFNDNGKLIGVLSPSGVFSKTVRASVHKFRILDAWGVEERVVNELRALNCSLIYIYDSENDNHYVVEFAVFDLNGIRRNFDTPQVFLPLSWFGNQLRLPDGKQKKRPATKKDSLTAPA